MYKNCCIYREIPSDTLKNKLVVFERKMSRKIFGPTKERDGTDAESKQTVN